ncbi:MAG: alanine/ornithine racemase family PLP-dependent enzyme [Eubacteriaceae bacterium]|jgi:predicted amino acid racemase|nr:alanine/ornithine racemase family PLP-dependent enzyme [Eubacteriaceae bacterium]
MYDSAGHLPKLTVDIQKLRTNLREVISRCGDAGIEVAGVVKGCNGIPEVSLAFEQAGCKWIASSRISQLAAAREAGVKIPLMLIRVPMLSEAADVIAYADVSLNSDKAVMKALSEEAEAAGKTHQVILMADIGDLREGFWGSDELCDAAEYAESLPGIELAGIGTNIGCYGSLMATAEKLQELVDLGKDAEARIGRRLDYISGGATSSFMRVLDGTIPVGINQLRMGEGILLARDWQELYGLDMPYMNMDVFTLEAEVIEVRDKPSYPVGEIGFSAFGDREEYIDRGIRKRALLAVGKADYGYPDKLHPRDEGVEVLGASSDHTILDIEDAEREIRVGDVMRFDLGYAGLLMLSSSPDVSIEVID